MTVPSAKGAIRASRQAYGRLSVRRRALPTMLVVGGQRCGTTSLFQAVRQHPGMVPPQFHKGLHFFDVAYVRGSDWYRSHFATHSYVERLRDRLGHDVVQFEVTPYYMFHPVAAVRIAGDLPGVKAIVMIRDPVERAYSAHAHEYARGFERLDFESAIAAEGARLEGEVERIRKDAGYVSTAHRHHAYRARGCYIEQLLQLETCLGKENLLVVDSAVYFREPRVILSQVFSFLGLPDADGIRVEVHNARRRPALPSRARDELRDYFDAYDRRLQDWLGWTPSWCP